MGGPLDLSGADLKGFEALDPGRYNAQIVKLENDAVKNASGQGKMPAGTPMIKIQYKVLEPKINGEVLDQDRRVFQTLVIPPKGYDSKKAATMNGMIARFFIAIGVPEEKVLGKGFNPMEDPEQFYGNECVVTLGREPKKDAQGNVIDGEYNNPVKGVKPAGTLVGSSAGGQLL